MLDRHLLPVPESGARVHGAEPTLAQHLPHPVGSLERHPRPPDCCRLRVVHRVVVVVVVVPRVAILALVRSHNCMMSDIAKHRAVVTAHFKRVGRWHICPTHVSDALTQITASSLLCPEQAECSMSLSCGHTSSARSHTRLGTPH